jgi:putative transposase
MACCCTSFQRGHNWQLCFFGEDECDLHAYVLMTNHAHLPLTPRHAVIPRMIMSLGRRYVQHLKTICRRSGTLWDSRHKSSLIPAETYLDSFPILRARLQ